MFVASLVLFQEPTAESVYDAYKAKIAGLNSATGVVEVEMTPKPIRYEFKILKPGYFFVGSANQHFISTGEKVWQYMPRTKEYNEIPKKNLPSAPLLNPVGPFFGVEEKDKLELSLADHEGKPSLIAIARPQPSLTFTAVIDRQTLLPTKWIQKMGDKESVSRYLDVRSDVPVDTAAFALPADARPMKPRDFAASLLPVGAKAPSFTLNAPTNKKIDLAKELKGGKALLLNFWFYG
jgi:outer membrane lipoprotein-sorting protein